jgi:hypothetical protein
MFSNDLPFPTFSLGTYTAAGATAFAAIIPPWSPDGSSAPYTADSRWVPNWVSPSGGAFTHVSSLVYTTGTTAHKIAILRPLNWTVLSSAAAGGQNVINIYDDPGVYSTNYKYPTPGGVVASVRGGSGGQGGTAPSQVADHGIAANDYAAYQLADGTWVADTVSSVSTLAITMTTNVPTGGVLKNSPFFYFGTVALNDPATGQPQWQTVTTVSVRAQVMADVLGGSFQSIHPGDPLIFYSPNTTAAGVLQNLSGFYAKH